MADARSAFHGRRALEKWFRKEGIRPDVQGEFNDSALLKAFGREGRGVFAAPTVLAREVARDYQVQVVGRLPDVVERYYVVSTSRKTSHPAVAEIWRLVRDRALSLARDSAPSAAQRRTALLTPRSEQAPRRRPSVRRP